jgi:hypothetical protein
MLLFVCVGLFVRLFVCLFVRIVVPSRSTLCNASSSMHASTSVSSVRVSVCSLVSESTFGVIPGICITTLGPAAGGSKSTLDPAVGGNIFLQISKIFTTLS